MQYLVYIVLIVLNYLETVKILMKYSKYFYIIRYTLFCRIYFVVANSHFSFNSKFIHVNEYMYCWSSSHWCFDYWLPIPSPDKKRNGYQLCRIHFGVLTNSWMTKQKPKRFRRVLVTRAPSFIFTILISFCH